MVWMVRVSYQMRFPFDMMECSTKGRPPTNEIEATHESRMPEPLTSETSAYCIGKVIVGKESKKAWNATKSTKGLPDRMVMDLE